MKTVALSASLEHLQQLLHLQEVSLSEVLQVRGSSHLSVPRLAGYNVHSFELVTASVTYCVVAGEQGPAWETAIRQALMPIQSSSSRHGQDGQGGSSCERAAISTDGQCWRKAVFTPKVTTTFCYATIEIASC